MMRRIGQAKAGLAADYTAGHFFNLSSLQRGFVNRTFDPGTGCRP
jgi:hypothetical protein